MASPKSLIAVALLASTLVRALAGGDDIVVIAHGDVPRLDLPTVQRLYTGRSVEVDGMPLTVVNLAPGQPERQRFLEVVMRQDDDRYRAYWTVRRHVGKGVPPRDVHDAAEVIRFVQGTPGAVGYLFASELKPGIHVVARP